MSHRELPEFETNQFEVGDVFRAHGASLHRVKEIEGDLLVNVWGHKFNYVDCRKIEGNIAELLVTSEMACYDYTREA